MESPVPRENPTPTGNVGTLLSALPQMFPGVQEIPLKNIRFDPDNPGTPITDAQTQELADDIAARGQQNPIQVCPDKANPLAPGAALHPDNPRLKADGTPWRVEDFNWMTLAGEGRSRAALRLQWVTIKGFIQNPTQEEAVKITYWDNRIRYRGDWWPDYQTIERLIKANPNLTQRQVATTLKLRLESVSSAIRLLPLLNPEARALIVPNRNN
jgi:ParB-like chromosome segregation protein Spo0J